ncbi:MAG: LysR family transcriptional regulator [Planctomycetota bacterium]
MRLPYQDLSLPQLRNFCTVVSCGSYAEAARRAELSTSAVWEQVRGLERHFELLLLENRRGRIEPTPDGRRLLELVLPLLAGLDSAKQSLHQGRGQAPGMITVASGVRMLSEEVSRAVARFRGKYPEVRVRLTYADYREIERLVEEGQADVALALEPRAGQPASRRIEFEPAYELDYLVVARKGHPLLSKKRLGLSDVVEYPLIVGTPGTASRECIDEVLHRHNLLRQATVAVETNSAVVTFACARAGAGIGVTAGHREHVAALGLGVRSLRKWFGAARYVFLWTKGAYRLPMHTELAEMIRGSG